jgi:hypothetical protein
MALSPDKKVANLKARRPLANLALNEITDKSVTNFIAKRGGEEILGGGDGIGLRSSERIRACAT